MTMEIFTNGQWLPLTFAFLMGLSMLIYAVLDGYDLGVGVLTMNATDNDKDKMVASIGPFWDANETWLVLGVGILLVAFPMAHGMILTQLYLPVAFMLIGLIFRGVAFDFRGKSKPHQKRYWNFSFFIGSLVTAFSQGYMLGSYIIGFESGLYPILFSCLVGFSVIAGYCLIGSSWLIMKTEKQLQKKAVRWAMFSLAGTVVGIALVSLATPFVSARIFEKWFAFPQVAFMMPIPIITTALVMTLLYVLTTLPQAKDRFCWLPFAMTISIFVLCFAGLAYSFFPYIVPDKLLIVDAASAHESLMIIFIGTIIVLPILLGYTFVVYKVFHGKATDLTYD